MVAIELYRLVENGGNIMIINLVQLTSKLNIGKSWKIVEIL